MPKYLSISLVAVLLCLGTSCNSGEEVDPILKDAFAIHQEAVRIEQTVQRQLDSFQISAEKELNLRARLEQWDEQLVEVPGFEHEHHHGHDHDHDHDHDHGSSPKVTPEHMLAIQQESLDSIRTIQRDLDRQIRRN